MQCMYILRTGRGVTAWYQIQATCDPIRPYQSLSEPLRPYQAISVGIRIAAVVGIRIAAVACQATLVQLMVPSS